MTPRRSLRRSSRRTRRKTRKTTRRWTSRNEEDPGNRCTALRRREPLCGAASPSTRLGACTKGRRGRYACRRRQVSRVAEQELRRLPQQPGEAAGGRSGEPRNRERRRRRVKRGDLGTCAAKGGGARNAAAERAASPLRT